MTGRHDGRAQKRPFSKRLFFTVLSLAAALAVGLGLFAAASRSVMVGLREDMLAFFRSQTGYDISYESISPSFFQFIEIRGLTVIRREAAARSVIAVDALRFHYDLFELVFASDKLRALSKIDVEGVRADVDAAKDRRLIDFLKGVFNDSNNEYRLSPRFALAGKDVNLSYMDGDARWALRRLFAAVTSADDSLSFTLHTSGEAAPQGRGRGSEYATDLDMAGKVSKDFSRLNADFLVESLRAGEVTLKEQQFHISLQDRTLDITKVQDRSPLDLSLTYSFDRELLSATFLADGLRPGDLIAFTDKLANLRPVLASTLTADGSLRYALAQHDLDFSLALDGALSSAVSPVAVRLHSRVTGTEEQINFAPFAVASEIGSIEFRGNVLYQTFFPEGYLRFINVKTEIGDDLNADLTVARSADSVTLTGDRISIGSAGFRSFILDVFPRPEEMRFAVNAALDMPLSEHHIKLDGALAYRNGYQLAVEGDLAAVPVNFIYRALTQADRFSLSLDQALENVLWSTRCSFATDFQGFTFTAPQFTLRDGKDPRNRLSFEIAADENEFRLSPWQGTWAGYTFAGDLTLQMQPDSGFRFASAFSVDNQKYAVDGRFLPGTGIMVSGSHGLSLLCVPQPNGAQVLSLKAAGLPVPIQGQTVYATLDWIGALSENGDLTVVSRRTSITGLPQLIPGMVNASADLRFSLENNRLSISELVYRDKISLLTGNGSLEFESAPETRASGWFFLADESQVEKYTAVLDLSPARSNASLFFENSSLAHWGALPVSGSASGLLTLRGPLDDPVVNVSLALQNGRVNMEPLALKADLSLSGAGLTIRSLDAAYSKNLKLADGHGGFDTRQGIMDFSARVWAGNQNPVEADIAFHAELKDFQRDAPPASLFDAPFKGQLAVIDPKAGEGEFSQWDIRFFQENGELNISGGPGEVLQGLVRRDGNFRIDLSPPFPLQGHAEGRINDNLIEARASNLVVLLPAINELLNTPYFVFKGGVARGDLSVTGPLGDPDFFGILSVDGLTASSLALADPVGPIQSVLEVKEKKATLRRVATKVGNSPLEAEAELLIDHWNISRFSTRLAVNDPLGAHVTLPLDIVAVDGFVTTPGLVLTGDYSGFSISGSLFVQKCDVVLGQSKPAEAGADKAEGNVEVDLAIKTGKQVEVYWPVREFPILRMLAEPGADLKIKYNQLRNELALNGDINFKGGNVYYVERNFLIREGSLSLKETQLDFNPVLNLKAERKGRYNDKDVKITLSVPNQHLKDFAPVFDTDPPLPITERYLALGTIIPPPADPSDDKYLASIVSDIGGDLLSQVVLLRPLEEKVKQILNLDGFTIRTQFISNLLLDAVFNDEASLPPSTAVSLGRYLNNTEISFQKYLDEKSHLFFETIVRIQADLVHGNTVGMSQFFGNVNVESEFSLELTTPFFLTIKWSITPEHWETFFLPDNKITFKWGISF